MANEDEGKVDLHNESLSVLSCSTDLTAEGRNIIGSQGKTNASNIGYSSFFAKSQSDFVELLFKDNLPPYFSKMPSQIKRTRNNLIYLTSLQIASSIFGMSLYLMRRTSIYIFSNLLIFHLALIGIYGSINFNTKALMAHCLFTTALPIGFLFYQLLLLFIENGETQGLGDHVILLLMGLPYMFDLFVGVYNFRFLGKVRDFGSTRKERSTVELKVKSGVYSEEDFKGHIESTDSSMCIVCCVNLRNTAVNPCGHSLACDDCMRVIFKKRSFGDVVNCPICRGRCQGFIKIIVS